MLSRNVASSDWREGTVQGHAEILKVIKSGDQKTAVEVTKEHISFAYERILQSYQDSSADSAGAADTGDVIPAQLSTSRRIPL